jgi:hypothetical protein
MEFRFDNPTIKCEIVSITNTNTLPVSFFTVQYLCNGHLKKEGGFKFEDDAKRFAARLQAKGCKVLGITSHLERA